MLGPTLETERLILRPPTPEDFEPWAAMMQDDAVAQFLGGVQPRSVAWRAMATKVGGWTLRGFSTFSVLDKQSGDWLGNIGPWEPEGWPGKEIGWALKREAWGKGIALEGARAAMDWAFGALGWTEVIHCIQRDNVASIALAERLGSTYRRTTKLPPPYEAVQVGIYGQDRGVWRQRSASSGR